MCQLHIEDRSPPCVFIPGFSVKDQPLFSCGRRKTEVAEPCTVSENFHFIVVLVPSDKRGRESLLPFREVTASHRAAGQRLLLVRGVKKWKQFSYTVYQSLQRYTPSTPFCLEKEVSKRK